MSSLSPALAKTLSALSPRARHILLQVAEHSQLDEATGQIIHSWQPTHVSQTRTLACLVHRGLVKKYHFLFDVEYVVSEDGRLLAETIREMS